MEKAVEKNGKMLKYGYTTGSCARIAVRAALKSLLLGIEEKTEHLVLRDDLEFDLEILDRKKTEKTASCAVRKYSGDDPDITNGTLIYAEVSVSESEQKEITIDGGNGIGRVTKKGLDQPVGAAAINSGPRKSITEEAEAIAAAAGFAGKISIVISAPEGEVLAKKTFNEKLGITGGISILGTTGILEPMSDRAVIETVKANLQVVRAAGYEKVVLVPGNIGETFATQVLGVSEAQVVQCSNYIGDALLLAAKQEFTSICLVGHVGKMVKLAGKMMNTHSMYGDCRKEIVAAYAALYGCSRDGIRAIMDSVSTDDMVEILRNESESVLRDTFEAITKEIAENIRYYIQKNLPVGMECTAKLETILFATDRTILGRS